jgi:DNA invertase Pin-like site-specific DNA recombinase
MLIGYARVRTDDQDLTLQRAALKEAGCRRLYEEKVSGARRDRPQLERTCARFLARAVVWFAGQGDEVLSRGWLELVVA